MNARNQTALDLANAILGRPRAKQTVHRVTSTYGGRDIWGEPAEPRHVIYVVPDGATEGQHYECSTRAWDMLKGGSTPEYLGLEPYEPEDEE